MEEHWIHSVLKTDRFISQDDKTALGKNWEKRLRRDGWQPHNEIFPTKAELLKNELADNKLSAREIISKIEETDSLSELHVIIENEERKTVLTAYSKRIQELENNQDGELS